MPNEFVEKKDIILLSEELLDGNKKYRNETILHEIAHFWLKHKSPLFEELTEEERMKEERDATKLAKKWLTSHRRNNNAPNQVRKP